jgi:SAM-dependent methyltransferase
MHSDMSDYFLGRKLYGDDFPIEKLETWYEQEKEGYAGEVLSRSESYRYAYHALNEYYGFRRIEFKAGASALGLGSAYGSEFIPILPRLGHVTILDPSDEFAVRQKLENVPVSYRKPSVDGTLQFPDNAFDLITCFGVLHHIANVSKVLSECRRCLALEGVMLCREPIVTQGDWRKPRRGMTQNERGIPYQLFLEMVRNAGLSVERASLFDFPPFVRFMHTIGLAVFASPVATRVDGLLARAFSFNTRYHRIGLLEKFGPASVFLVLRKRQSG